MKYKAANVPLIYVILNYFFCPIICLQSSHYYTLDFLGYGACFIYALSSTQPTSSALKQ